MTFRTQSEKFYRFMKDGKTPRCQESIMRYVGNWPHTGQCSRSAKVGDRCKQHDPAAVEARKQASSDKWDREWYARRLEIHGPRFYAVLERIAAGHNDPRTLAQETIDKHKKKV